MNANSQSRYVRWILDRTFIHRRFPLQANQTLDASGKCKISRNVPYRTVLYRSLHRYLGVPLSVYNATSIKVCYSDYTAHSIE